MMGITSIIKLFIFLTIIGVIYCGQEEEEAAIDIIATKYERYGIGVEYPESLDIIRDKCNKTGTSVNGNGTLFWDIVTGLKWAGYLKPEVREVILESPKIAFYEKLNLYCKLPEDKQVKYAQLTNVKLNETKMLRDRFLGYLEEAGNQSKINMGEIVCIGRNYWEKLITLHDDQDGFREFANKSVEIYPAVLNRTEHLLKVKVDTTCELKESYPEATKYKSFIISLSNILPKFLNLTTTP